MPSPRDSLLRVQPVVHAVKMASMTWLVANFPRSSASGTVRSHAIPAPILSELTPLPTSLVAALIPSPFSAVPALPHQTVRTDELDEGLVLLSRIVSWDPIDLTYASMLTNHEGAVRWDKKPLKRAPDPADLDVDVSDEAYEDYGGRGEGWLIA